MNIILSFIQIGSFNRKKLGHLQNMNVFCLCSGSSLAAHGAVCSAHKTDGCHQPTKSGEADNMYLMYIDIDVKTSFPYFGVKLSCICLMIAYRKKFPKVTQR